MTTRRFQLPDGGDPNEGPRGRRASRAARAPRLAGRDRPQRLDVVEPRGPGPLRAPRSRGLGGSGAQPGGAAAAAAAGAPGRRGRRRELRRHGGPRRAPPRRLRERPRLVPGRPPGRGGHEGRLLLARVRPRRRHPALLGRPRHPGRRPPEVAPPTSACRWWGSACSTAAATSGSRSAPTAASASATRPPTGATCRSPTSPAATASRSSSRWRSGASPFARRVRRIQVGRVPLLLLDADVEGNSPEAREITSVLYGGDREMRIRQEILLGRRRRAGAGGGGHRTRPSST